LTFAEGILTFISPCILPMLPVYFIYLAGASKEESDPGARRKNRIPVNAIGFVAGFTVLFVLLGAAASFMGSFLSEHRILLQRISGLVMVLFGLNFMGVIRLRFLNEEKRPGFNVEKMNFFRSILFGAVFGLGWTPCLGAFLGSALLLAGSSDTVLQGILLLLVYSIGLGIPFLLSSILFDSIKGAFAWINRHGRAIGILSGILLIAAGVLIFADILKYL
jgi:cytochrome c-type biogenesis protein